MLPFVETWQPQSQQRPKSGSSSPISQRVQPSETRTQQRRWSMDAASGLRPTSFCSGLCIQHTPSPPPCLPQRDGTYAYTGGFASHELHLQ
ncbi:uncharacterized protein LY79DRAFT_543494 [Colletotrichum navitas]|uniref:Uncharacterized protein n=1 Tax=Colletotrichum navitas TaxID=681940 RepID=A0AAD8Q7B0_9PEZI|nr:uncharacterized protein LY79DRAFT_543494 [Colletotrichum navitas]KAK1596533.1 hypothetical protein LY79DRAFT_543494 [Colletotrichum navitas]